MIPFDQIFRILDVNEEGYIFQIGDIIYFKETEC